MISGTVLMAISIDTIASSVLGALLFASIALLYNFIILIPIRKIMRDEPLKVEIQEAPKETASVIG